MKLAKAILRHMIWVRQQSSTEDHLHFAERLLYEAASFYHDAYSAHAQWADTGVDPLGDIEHSEDMEALLSEVKTRFTPGATSKVADELVEALFEGARVNADPEARMRLFERFLREAARSYAQAGRRRTLGKPPSPTECAESEDPPTTFDGVPSIDAGSEPCRDLTWALGTPGMMWCEVAHG